MRREDGTALIELALAIIVILMLALGTYEWGTGFSDRIGMSAASREGARVGSAAGDDSDADCAIIEAAAGSLSALAGNTVEWLWIYESNPDGDVLATRQVYRPQASGDLPVNLRCNNKWFLFTNGWPAGVGNRQDGGANRDYLGVKVIVIHSWRTGFLWWNGDVTWEEDAVMRIEPAIS